MQFTFVADRSPVGVLRGSQNIARCLHFEKSGRMASTMGTIWLGWMSHAQIAEFRARTLCVVAGSDRGR